MNTPAAPHRCLEWGCTAAYANAADLARHTRTCTGAPIQRTDPRDVADDFDDEHGWRPRLFHCTEPGCDHPGFTETLALFNPEQMHERLRRKERRRQEGTGHDASTN